MKTLKNLLFVAKLQRKWLFILGMAVFVSSVFEAIGVGSILPLVDLLQNEDTVLKYNRYLVMFGFGERDYRQLLFLIVFVFLVVILLKNVFVVMTTFMKSTFQNLVRTSLSTTMYSNYLSREYNFFVVTPHGLLLQRLTAIVDQATTSLSILITIAIHLVTVGFIYAVLMVVSLKLTLFVTFLIAILTVIAGIVSRYRAYASGKEIVELEGRQYSTAAETITGIRIIRAFTAEEFISRKFNTIVRRLARIRIINDTIFNIPAPAIETIMVTGLCGFIIIASQKAGHLPDMLPILSMFGYGMMRIMQKVSTLYSSSMQLANYLPAVNVVAELISDKQSAKTDGKKFVGLKEGIGFKNVTFAYPQAPDQKVLDSVTFRIKRRQFVGIVGPSGSGKSTIVDLIIGLYEPLQGEILIDKDSLESLNINSWRSRIGFVNQETILFNGTIKENIAFADSDIDMSKVGQAASMANAHGFISRLPDGYDTEVGERGLKLSGGERQRLAIARALYRDPEIIILDEATSSLDTKSEKEVQKAIENLDGEKTIIVIAHRLSTIINADWTYVINDGKIAEEGTHQTLTEKKGIYWELCRKQNLHGAH